MTTSSANPTDRNQVRRYNTLFAALQSSYWMSFCSLIGFSVVLLTTLQFSAGEIGTILAAASVASIIAQPLLAAIVSRYPEQGLYRLILISLSAAVLSTTLLFPGAGRIGITLAAFILIGVTEIALQPFINSLFLQYVNAGYPLSFGLTRGLGSLAYALTGAAMGLLIGRLGTAAILPVHMAFLVLTILVTLPLKPSGIVLDSHPSSQTRNRGSIREIFAAKPAIAGLLAATILSFISFNSLVSFTPMIIRNVGGQDADLGLIVFLMALSEVPTMFLYSRLERLLGAGRLLLIAFFFLLVRPILFAAAPNMTVLLLVQPVQMAGYGLFIPAVVHYINTVLPDNLRVRGQAVMSTGMFGIAQVIANLAGGWIIELGGLGLFFTFNIGCAVIGLFLALMTTRKARRNA